MYKFQGRGYKKSVALSPSLFKQSSESSGTPDSLAPGFAKSL